MLFQNISCIDRLNYYHHSFFAPDLKITVPIPPCSKINKKILRERLTMIFFLLGKSKTLPLSANQND